MTGAPRGATIAFASVTTLFFAWGFVSANNDPLIAALRTIFSLSYTEALLTQIVFFLAYGIMSIPAALLLGRVGSIRAILIALSAMIVGCFIIQFSGWAPHYPVVLAGLFVLAGGITTLQVAANPLAAALGPPERSHFRLTLAQSFNSLGVVCGVHFGARLMLSGDIFTKGTGAIHSDADRAAALAAVNHVFLTIAALLVILMAFLWAMRRSILSASVSSEGGGRALDALRSRWALLGAAAIAVYVGAEVSIGSIMIGFLNRPDMLGLPPAEAGVYLANFYWGGALLGRFAGSWLLTRLPAARLLAAAAVAAVALCALALVAPGPIATWCALAVGLFNAIMFPTIFTLTLERSSAPQSATSGLLCLAIVGGAILPLLVGQIADHAGLGLVFIVPLAAYAYIAVFALRCAQANVMRPHSGAAPALRPARD